MSTDFAEWAIQFSMATAGIWWYGFALVTFAWVPEPPVENEMEKLKFRQAARFAVGEVTQTLKDYKGLRNKEQPNHILKSSKPV
jgi:hypothetical protein